MRPRYRVWDKKNKKMIYNVERTHDRCPVDVPSFGAILDCPDLYEVMQYTGKKDIRGKRIYEKDIIKFTKFTKGTEKDIIGFVEYWEDECKYTISDSFYNIHEFISGGPDVHGYISEIEILGNLYENEELSESFDWC